MRSYLPLLCLVLGCSEYTIDKPPTVEDIPPATMAPDIEVDRMLIDFGSLPPQCDTTQPLIVRNVGGAELYVSDLVTGGAFTVDPTGPLVLAPGEEALATLQFVPDITGPFDGVLDLYSNDPDEGILTVTLQGSGDLPTSLEEIFDQTGSLQPVDILFVIDNSTSMGDENIALQNNFNTFIQGFLTLGLDFQIGVVTTDMQTPGYIGEIQGPIIDINTPNPVQQFNQNTDIPFTDVLEEQGLDAVQTALTAPLITTTNAGLVRPGSLLSVIVISDEDDQSFATPADLIALIDGYQGDPDLSSLSIVGGPKTGIFPCGGFLFGAAPVPTYWEVAQATGGIHLNLCQLDMSAIVQALAVVAAGLDTSFPLSSVPSDPSQITVLVDGVAAPVDPDNGWVYNAATNSIVFAGAAIPPAGSQIRVQLPGEVVCP